MTLTASFHSALLARGSSAAYARKMVLTVERAGADPGAFLTSLAASATQATVDDMRNRLRIYAGWLRAEGHADEAARYEDLPRPTAAKRAQDRASFTAAEVRRLIECERIPAHRRAAYLVMAHLGLRPVEVQRLRAEHVVQSGTAHLLMLPGSDQKSGRADTLHVSKREASAIREHAPLIREPLTHYERTFHLDLMHAGIPGKQGTAMRRLYDLRSFYGSELLRQGLDVESVRMLMRHRRVETTLKHYTRHQSAEVGKRRAEIFRVVA